MNEYYLYKQTGFNAEEREEIQSNITPFEILTRYQPKNYILPIVSDKQIKECKQHYITNAEKKNFKLQ